jgi:hypothetical protein
MKRSERNKIKAQPETSHPIPNQSETAKKFETNLPLGKHKSPKDPAKTQQVASESKQPQRTRNTKQQRNPRVSAATFVKSHKLLLEILGLPLAVLTIAGFCLSSAPKISVDASESVSSGSPMGTTFDLSNQGALEIHDVIASAANLHLENSDPTRGFQVLQMGPFTNVPTEAKAEVLSPGHKMGLPYAPAFGYNFTGGSLTIVVRYRPAYVWWHKTEIFPFRAVRSTSGSWIWKSVPQ